MDPQTMVPEVQHGFVITIGANGLAQLLESMLGSYIIPRAIRATNDCIGDVSRLVLFIIVALWTFLNHDQTQTQTLRDDN
jgi:hypothetical protein